MGLFYLRPLSRQLIVDPAEDYRTFVVALPSFTDNPTFISSILNAGRRHSWPLSTPYALSFAFHLPVRCDNYAVFRTQRHSLTLSQVSPSTFRPVTRAPSG